MRNDKKAAGHLRRIRKELAGMVGYGDGDPANPVMPISSSHPRPV